MASRRILTLLNQRRSMLILCGIVLLFTFYLSGCGTSRKAINKPVAKKTPKTPTAKKTTTKLLRNY